MQRSGKADAANDASEFDAGNYGKLLDKAWDEVPSNSAMVRYTSSYSREGISLSRS